MTSTGEEGRREVTRLLAAIEDGSEPRAAESLLPIVYDELRDLARQRMSREPPGQTIQATALVHEAYLRLTGGEDPAPAWANRAHFFSAAALAMRRILVERARRRARARHGGAVRQVALSESAIVGGEEALDHLDLDAALTRLEGLDRRRHQVVMLRYYAGLSIEDAALALDVSPATVKADWSFARAWLHRELARD